MQSGALESFRVIDASGQAILAAIAALLAAGVTINLAVVRRYASIERELATNPDAASAFSSSVLERIVADVRGSGPNGRSAPAQTIVENAFQSELRGMLVAERFVRAVTGILIILGLIGTFYGLSSSIGKLVRLVTGDVSTTEAVGEALTRGLSEALSGMAVAFSTSLAGILAAIVMMLLNVISNVTDRRTAVMVRVERYLEELLGREFPAGSEAALGVGRALDREAALARFDETVERLDRAVSRFAEAQQGFAANTRDFHEFNLHLKDNVQRMSLSFADFSQELKAQVAAIAPRERR